MVCFHEQCRRSNCCGCISNDGGGSNSGHARVFDWNGTAWTQVGADINGEAANDKFGRMLFL
jgi:hypothetical protein